MRSGAMAIVCLGALAVCPAGRAAVAEITVTLSPVADAEVRSASPDTNLGLLATATVSPEGVPPGAMPAYVYLRFDLSGLPSEAQVQEATLTMQAFSGYAWGGDGTVYVHFVAGDGWPEAGITWNTRPAQSATILGSWWLWYDFPDADQLGATSTPALAAAVQAQADGDNLLSVMLRSPGYMTEYRTREYGVVAQRPKLTLRIRTAADGVGRVPDGTTGLPLRLTKLEPGGGGPAGLGRELRGRGHRLRRLRGGYRRLVLPRAGRLLDLRRAGSPGRHPSPEERLLPGGATHGERGGELRDELGGCRDPARSLALPRVAGAAQLPVRR